MTDQTSANLLPPPVFPVGFVGSIAMLVIMVHVAVFWWLWGESDNSAPEDQLAEISVEIVASRSLLVPNQAPEQPSDVVPEPEPEPEPASESEPEPEPEPAEPASEAAPTEPAPEADPELKPTSESESEIPPEIPAEAPSMAPSPVEDFSVPIMNATHEADGLDNPVPQYPPAAYFDRLEGTVTLRVKVLSDGRVDEVVINESSGHRILDESARSTISDWNFVPARREGRPITQWVDVPITFQLVEE